MSTATSAPPGHDGGLLGSASEGLPAGGGARGPRRRGLLPLLVLLLLPSLGCPPPPPPPILVGLVTYRSSDLNGPPTSNAVLMAVDEANAGGGLQVGGSRRRVEIREAVIQEDSSEQAVAAVQRLINQEKVCAILGPQLSVEAIPAGGLADRARVPLISPISSHALTTKDRPFVFRACFRDDAQGKALASFAREQLHARTAALMVAADLAYSRTIAEVFRREFLSQGGRIVADCSFVESQGDLTPQLKLLRRSSADVLLFPNYSNSTRAVGIAARRAGIRSVFLGTDSWNRLQLRSLPEFDGSYMVTNWFPGLETPGNPRFLAEYARRFSTEPTETAALTYDAARLLFTAIACTSDGSPAAIQKALYGPLDFVGTSGRIRYGSNGDPEKAVVVLQFRKGKDVFTRVMAPGGER
jgi:branched-chain amino acid transport system substrate-binding protein